MSQSKMTILARHPGRALIVLGFFTALLAAAVLLRHAALRGEPQHRGKPMSFWLKVFDDSRACTKTRRPGRESYDDAVNALLAIGEQAAPALAERLVRHLRRTPSWYERKHPWLQKKLPAAVVRHLPRPRNMLFVRNQSYSLLMFMGQAARGALPGLADALSNPDADARWMSAEILGSIGPEARSSVPDLIAALRDKDYAVRTAACISLGKIGQDPGLAVPALLDAFESGRVPVNRAVEAMHRLGHVATEALPALVALMRTPRSDDHLLALETLRYLGKDATMAVPDVRSLLLSKSSQVRARAARVLAGLGPQAVPAVPELASVLHDLSWFVRADAASALGRIGPASVPALPMLRQLVDDPNNDVRAAAGEAVALIGAGRISREVP